LRVLSTLADLQLENPQLHILISFKLEELGEDYLDSLVHTLKRLLEMKEEDLHAKIFLAVALVDRANKYLMDESKNRISPVISAKELARTDYKEAIDNLKKVFLSSFFSHFPSGHLWPLSYLFLSNRIDRINGAK